jgi:acyl carrier protein
MDNVETRLKICFEAVFPDIAPEEILQSSQRSIPAWDSVAVITLANTIEEEFDFQMDFDRLPELDSFERMLIYVKTELRD